MRKGNGLTSYSKADASSIISRNRNKARAISNMTYKRIESEEYKIKKAQNPTKPKNGPYLTITNYIDFMGQNGFQVSDDDIIKYMQNRMPKLERDYIQSLIKRARERREPEERD